MASSRVEMVRSKKCRLWIHPTYAIMSYWISPPYLAGLDGLKIAYSADRTNMLSTRASRREYKVRWPPAQWPEPGTIHLPPEDPTRFDFEPKLKTNSVGGLIPKCL